MATKQKKQINYSPYRTSIYHNLMRHYCNLANVLFSWKGGIFESTKEKAGIPAYALEMILFWQGQALIFKEDEDIFIGFPAKLSPLDSIGRMTRVQPYTLDGRTHKTVYIRDYYTRTGQLKKQNAVLVMNNASCTPTASDIYPIVLRQDYAWGSIGLGEAGARAKNIIYADDSQTKAVLQAEINRLTDDMNPYIVLYKKSGLMDPESTGRREPIIDPSQLADLWNDFLRAQQLILDRLGISNNPNIDKMERLTSAEATTSNHYTDLSLAAMLESRQRACEEIDRLFGTTDTSCVSYFDHRTAEMSEWYRQQGIDYPGTPGDNEGGEGGAENNSQDNNDSGDD